MLPPHQLRPQQEPAPYRGAIRYQSLTLLFSFGIERRRAAQGDIFKKIYVFNARHPTAAGLGQIGFGVSAMPLMVIGALLLVLLAAAVSRYALSWEPLAASDRVGALIFFIVVGFPFVVAALAMIARYASR
jgi:hypothetical protein